MIAAVNNDFPNWGLWIKQRLAFLEMSQRELAKRLGVKSETVNRWLAGQHMLSFRERYVEDLAEQIKLHSDDLPYAHLLYRPDDDEIDPERPRIAEFVNTVYTERRVGTRYPILAESEGEMRPMPQVLAEAAGWYQHELKLLVERLALAARPSLIEATKEVLAKPDSGGQPYALGFVADPLKQLLQQANKLPRDFDIPDLARSLKPMFEGTDPHLLDLDRLIRDIEDLSARPDYRLYVRAVQLNKDLFMKRINDIDAERERQAIEKELADLQPMLKAAKRAHPRRGKT